MQQRDVEQTFDLDAIATGVPASAPRTTSGKNGRSRRGKNDPEGQPLTSAEDGPEDHNPQDKCLAVPMIAAVGFAIGVIMICGAGVLIMQRQQPSTRTHAVAASHATAWPQDPRPTTSAGSTPASTPVLTQSPPPPPSPSPLPSPSPSLSPPPSASLSPPPSASLSSSLSPPPSPLPSPPTPPPPPTPPASPLPPPPTAMPLSPPPDCDDSFCSSAGDPPDCCAPSFYDEVATCSGGMTPVQLDTGCFDFDDGAYTCCPPPLPAPPSPPAPPAPPPVHVPTIKLSNVATIGLEHRSWGE